MRRLLRFVPILAAAVCLGAPALSDDVSATVDAAKARCEIGETITGFLEAVPDKTVSRETLAAMREINIKRRAVYARLAANQNVSLEVVARLTGERQVRSASTGECVRPNPDEWVQR